jgi:PAS domain S-box-containing protein
MGRASVLVVEDDALLGEAVQADLSRAGYRVVGLARSADEALILFEEHTPDVVLMDIQIQGADDGVVAAARIHALCNVPIIYLTSISDEATLGRANAAGAQGYLLKPVNRHDLRTAIEVALHKHVHELELARREHWIRTTLRSIGDAVIATDTGGRVSLMNGRAEALTGVEEAEALGKHLREVLRLADAQGAPVAVDLDAPSRAQPSAARLSLGVDADPRYVEYSVSPILDQRGQALGSVVVVRDVTERRALEARVAMAERLAAIGTMTAGMAHEINNPLAVVVGNAAFIAEELAALESDATHERLANVREAAGDTLRAAERVRQIVHDLKKFARAEALDREPTRVDEALEVALRLTQHHLRHKARVEREYSRCPVVDGSEGLLAQVFTNLLVNAADAIPDGHATEHVVRIACGTDARGWAVVEVQDSGAGIPEANLPKVFQPFFTTKEVGAGMGVGLAICHGIVGSLGGDISASSSPGRGTTFRVALPPSGGGAVSSVPAQAPAAEGRRGRILVVDDEPLVARAVERILARDHDVTVETSGRAALARVASEAAFDLVLCDLMMPEMSGADVFAALQRESAAQARRVLFLTGGAFSPEMQTFLASIPNKTVQKPFSTEGLRALVAAAVREAPAS